MIKLRSVLDRYEASELSQLEAAELLGMGERTFRRWRRRFEGEGEAGLVDRRLGKPSGKQVPVDEAMRVEALYRTRFCGFTAKHFHEHLVRSRVQVGVHVDQDVLAFQRASGEGEAVRGASTQATAPADTRHDAAPGRLAARVDRRA